MPFLLSLCAISVRVGSFADNSISGLRISVFKHFDVEYLLAGVNLNGSYLGSICKEKHLSGFASDFIFSHAYQLWNRKSGWFSETSFLEM